MSEATSGASACVSPGYRFAHPGYETTNKKGYYETTNKKGGPLGAAFFRVISIASSSAVAADHRAHGLVGSEILGAINIEQR